VLVGNRECGRRDVQRDVLRYVLREMRWLASPFVDWARSRGGVHSRHEQLLVPRASSEGVWAFLCRCCMRSRVATTARPAPDTDENLPVLPSHLPSALKLVCARVACRTGRIAHAPDHPPRSRTRQPRPPSGQPPGSVSASLLVLWCRFAAPTRGRADSDSRRARPGRPHARRVILSIAAVCGCGSFSVLETYSETVEW
jgi:hypothetical protein